MKRFLLLIAIIILLLFWSRSGGPEVEQEKSIFEEVDHVIAKPYVNDWTYDGQSNGVTTYFALIAENGSALKWRGGPFRVRINISESESQPPFHQTSGTIDNYEDGIPSTTEMRGISIAWEDLHADTQTGYLHAVIELPSGNFSTSAAIPLAEEE